MSANLILASASPYRQKLLQRLQLPFSTHPADIDETPLINEAIEDYVQRMTLEKGRKVATLYQGDSLILSSDQTALFAGEVIQKPGTIEKALTQLMRFSGNTVTFLTGIAITRVSDMKFEYRLVPFEVTFKELTEAEILSYLAKESVLDCAGSFKCEGLGIRLFKKMAGDDPTALEGLPLIATSELLIKFGLDPLG